MITMSFISPRICAWCNTPLGTRETSGAMRGKPSHGICKICLTQMTAPKRASSSFGFADDEIPADAPQNALNAQPTHF